MSLQDSPDRNNKLFNHFVKIEIIMYGANTVADAGLSALPMKSPPKVTQVIFLPPFVTLLVWVHSPFVRARDGIRK